MRSFAVSFVLVLGTIATVNYAVDINCLWRDEAAGRMRHWPEGMAWRLRVNELESAKRELARTSPRPETIVLGSSHMLAARGKGILNMAFWQARLPDVVRMWEFIKTTDCVPARIIISADPWLFNGYRGHNSWSVKLHRFVSDLNKSINDWWSAVIGWNTFTHSLDIIRSGERGRFVAPAEIAAPNTFGIMQNGDYVQIGFEGPQTDVEAFKAEEEYYTPLRQYMVDNWELDLDLVEQFKKLLRDMRTNGVNTIALIAAPEMPSTRKFMREHRHLAYAEADREMTKLKQEGFVDILWLDRNIETMNCSEAEFYDGHHPIGTCMEKLLKKALSPL